ncbi:hypothetical protein G6011_05224 [Alternaria panax]|uniref:Uncharacterized protein n=1 Tax=Alternaria panax TaxID=48097 RepID=A0AAD4FEE3_9PLEO|nr:hypothetical protein G6011_05224 [Alternaria panax]
MRVDWDLPLRFFSPSVLVVLLSLWGSGTLLIPSYEDVSMIKEYLMMIGSSGPSMRSQKGFFAYSVGQQQSSQLLSSAAQASSFGMNSHVHRKLDNTHFSYQDRSYGVGAPIRLKDQGITSNSQFAGYICEEPGKEGPEYSKYISHDSKAIVAMGVAYSDRSPCRYLSIAAGEAHSFLNTTQCEFDFMSTISNVTDDVLVSYASAQLVVRRIYIYAIFSLNLIIIIAVICKAFRTTGWSSLGRFNYLDPRDLIIAALRGGGDIAAAADGIMERREGKRMRHIWLLSDPDEGNVSLIVNLRGDQDGHVGIEVGAGQCERDVESVYPADEKTMYMQPEVAAEKGPLTPKTPMKMNVGIFGSK